MNFELFVLVSVSVLSSFFLTKYAVFSFENHLGLVRLINSRAIWISHLLIFLRKRFLWVDLRVIGIGQPNDFFKIYHERLAGPTDHHHC